MDNENVTLHDIHIGADLWTRLVLAYRIVFLRVLTIGIPRE